MNRPGAGAALSLGAVHERVSFSRTTAEGNREEWVRTVANGERIVATMTTGEE